MFKVGIVEDDRAYAAKLRELLVRYGQEKQLEFDIKEYGDGLDFLEAYRPLDIVFMDIDMPYMNGLAVAKKLRQKDKDVYLIFVTNLAQYAVKGYEVDASDFIVKPPVYEGLAYRLDKVIAQLKKRQKGALVLTYGRSAVRVDPEDIRYLETNKHNVVYHMHGDTFEVRESLSDAEQKLDPNCFVRPNSGCIVNLRYVDCVVDDEVHLGETIIPISRGRRKLVLDKLTTFLGDDYR